MGKVVDFGEGRAIFPHFRVVFQTFFEKRRLKAEYRLSSLQAAEPQMSAHWKNADYNIENQEKICDFISGAEGERFKLRGFGKKDGTSLRLYSATSVFSLHFLKKQNF